MKNKKEKIRGDLICGFIPTSNLYKKVNLVSGFTLIELLVSTSIFVMIMLSAMGSLFVLLNAAKNSRALRFSIDNVNFTMESMTRSIRMGTNYYCLEEGEINMTDKLEDTMNCKDGGSFISFVPQNIKDHRIGYIWVKRDDGTGTKTVKKCSPDGCVEMVSSNVNVENLRFFVNGAEEVDRQASVYIIMKGSVMVKDTPIPFYLQTMASMRNF